MKKKRKRRHPLRRLLAFLLILAAAGYVLAGVLYGKMDYRQIDSLKHEHLKEEGVMNVLLIGNDSRENGTDGRSDAMLLLSVSSRTGKVYLTSLLRDMYVDIPGHDGNRLNAAYAYGGPELLMKTVEQNLGIPVNRYLQVNFEAFVSLVDAVGGVDLELTAKEVEYVNGYLVEYNILNDRPQGTDDLDLSKSGMVHLNGPQALAYSRNRLIGTDFARTERQRKVLSAVAHKLPLAFLLHPGKILDGMLPNLQTNLTRNECIRLGLAGAPRVIFGELVQDSIPRPGTYEDATIRKMSVLKVDFDANRRYLLEQIYGQ